MRLVSFHTEDGPAAAVQLGEDLVPVSTLDAPSTTVRGLLAALDAEGMRELQRRAEHEQASARIPLADVTLHAPIADPQKIICLGLNYLTADSASLTFHCVMVPPAHRLPGECVVARAFRGTEP